MPLGQFYAISADMQKPYIGLRRPAGQRQLVRPERRRAASNGILNSDWFRVGGGDGFYTAQDPTDWTVVYSESQDGNTNRRDLRTGTGAVDPAAPAQAGGRGAGAATSRPA